MQRLVLLLVIFTISIQVSANESSYYNEYYEKENTYCAPKETLLTKFKNAFIGVPTGYTPQIEPSPYINSFGPSYMRGFYGRNSWADHNIYSPTVTGLGAHMLD